MDIFSLINDSFLLMQCFKGIALEADQLLNELQVSITEQQEKLASFAKKQHDVSSFTSKTRSLNSTLLDFVFSETLLFLFSFPAIQ